MTRKVYLLSAALLLTSACDDDDGSDAVIDNSVAGDSAVRADATTADAGSIDSGSGGGNIDASTTVPPSDSAVPADSATPVDATVVAPIAVAGSWHDTAFGGMTLIDATTFGFANLIEYDNVARVAITQNKPNDVFGPNQFSKIVWLPIVNDRFFYCTVGFGLDTLEQARSANMSADTSDPANGGCGDMGFPWTQLEPSIEIEGNWLQGTSAVTISSDALGDVTLESYDNATNTAVTSVTTPGSLPKFSKLRWTQPSASTLYLCYVARDFVTEGQAADDTTQASATELETGCLGDAWTALTLAP